MTEELKPCPMCGKSVAKVTTSSDMFPEQEDEGNSESYAVVCDAHMPNGPGGCGASGGFAQTEGEAIAAWNRRAAPVEPEPNPWREAVIDRLVVLWNLTDDNENDPRRALADIERMVAMHALDPDISSEAQALIDRGRAEATAVEPEPADRQEYALEQSKSYSRGHDDGWTSCARHYAAHPPRTPLTDEQIDLITCKNWGSSLPGAMIDAFREYARAVEQAHGIRGPK